ncbi:MAG: RNA polymerase sigma factor RpoH [Gammaproteobacteria bacterium]|nr:RNA polymerase sigma factor RpoH [Gammaproteobacteria bacterium]
MGQLMTATNHLPSPIGSFDAYLAIVNGFTRLDAEQEYALACRFRDQNDLDAAQQLILANLRHVPYIAKSYSGYGLPQPDLVQEGNVGLMKALKRFDPEQGVRLISFAVHWIRAEMHEFIIKNWRIVKIATTKAQRKVFFNLRKSKKQLGWMTESEARKIAADLDIDVDTLRQMEGRMERSDMAFDSSPDDSDQTHQFSPSTYLQDTNLEPSAQVEALEQEKMQLSGLSNALQQLDERSRDIIKQRWLSESKSTLHELADQYQVSAERIRQLENNAIKKLKNGLSNVYSVEL